MLIRGVLLTLAVGLQLVAAVAAAAEVATAVLVSGTVTAATVAGVARPLVTGDRVAEGEVVETSGGAFAVLLFEDETRITVRPDSRLEISGYAATGPEKSALFEMIEGGLKIITGGVARENPEGFRVRTRLGTISVRGTRFMARLCGDDCLDEQRALGGAVQGLAPGLFAPVFEHGIFLDHDGQRVVVDAGATGLSTGERLVTLNYLPRFLQDDPFPWPDDFGPGNGDDGAASDIATDQLLGALRRPVLQPVDAPGAERGLPDWPVYRQEPDALSGLQPSPPEPAVVPPPEPEDKRPDRDERDDEPEQEVIPDPVPPPVDSGTITSPGDGGTDICTICGPIL